MIILGGYIFWAIILLFLVLSATSLYNDLESWAVILLIAFSLSMVFMLDRYPDIDYRWLLLYPLGILAWCPTYWYLALKRRAKYVVSEGGKIEFYESGYAHSYLYKDDSDVIKLRHPPIDEIVVNSLLFPISMPIFICEDMIRSVVDYLTNFMNKVRDSISESI